MNILFQLLEPMPTKKTKAITLPAYQTIDQALQSLNISASASEVHGTLCGLLCVGAVDSAEQYMQTLLEGVDPKKAEQSIRTLAALLQIAYQQIETLTFDFHLLLPDDETSLRDRAQALGLWCEGFSEGFLQSGFDMTCLTSQEAKDALFHITEISDLDYESLSISEEDEKAYMELYEYIRMAVLMLHTELTKQSSLPSEQGKRTVH